MRELTSSLAANSEEHVILDMEAGVEHLSRGTTRNMDTLLVIAEPYYKSLETAARVYRLGQELGIRRVVIVANKVRNGDGDSMRAFAERQSLPVFLEVPHDESVAEADRLGVAPIDHDASCPFLQRMESLAGRLAES